MSRFLFAADMANDTGYGDTGRSVMGTVKQLQWVVTTADTGADMTLALNPRDTDTGHATVFYTAPAGGLGSDFIKYSDTGALAKSVFGQGDNLRVLFSNSTTLVGNLYVWVEEDESI